MREVTDFVLGMQIIPAENHIKKIQHIMIKHLKKKEDLMWAATYVFNYGVIVGKQQERAKRNRGVTA